MGCLKTRFAAVVCGLAAVLLAWPSEGQGGWLDWTCPSCSPSPALSTTTYTPVYATPRVSLSPVFGCPPAAAAPVARTCWYAPQTGYRWSYSRMPITTYRPVTTMDPCTGCARVVYQPVTRKTLLPWLHQKPYTSYRLTCSPTCAPSCPTVCNPCWPSSCGVGCGVGSLAPMTGSSCAGGCGLTTPGSWSTDSAYGPIPTYKEEPATGTSGEATEQPEIRMKPSNELEGNPASTGKPRVLRGEDRTAARPIQYATYRRPVTWRPAASRASQAPLDFSGWRASRD